MVTAQSWEEVDGEVGRKIVFRRIQTSNQVEIFILTKVTKELIEQSQHEEQQI